MLQSLLNSFKTGCGNLVRKRVFLTLLSGSVLILVLLKLVFPLVAENLYSGNVTTLTSYYTFVAITLLVIVPPLTGMIYARDLLNETGLHFLQSYADNQSVRRSITCRMAVSSIVSFVLVLIIIILSDPVPSEGWLRNLFAAFLFSVQAPFTVLLTVSASKNKSKKIVFTILYGLVLVAAPLGLILHHPWNYFVFFSPLYWAAWAWIVQAVAESLVYGTIALILSVATIILLRIFLRKPVQ
jgi:hypothetical protein